ncbi:MAG TPA: hypothetical protein VGL42_09285 [Opitutaceae bacterium]|jgi:hypothetical protein
MYKFLLVDSDHDALFYYGRTLLRKFPQAELIECRTAEAALRRALDRSLSGIVCHRAGEVGAEDLIPLLRQRQPETPIIWVGAGVPRVAAREIGADRFLPFEEWLMVGTLMSELVGVAPTATAEWVQAPAQPSAALRAGFGAAR